LVERAEDVYEWLLTLGGGLEGGMQKRSSWLLFDVANSECVKNLTLTVWYGTIPQYRIDEGGHGSISYGANSASVRDGSLPLISLLNKKTYNFKR
jgi:hypothetical protein